MIVSDNGRRDGALRYAELRAPSASSNTTFPMCYGTELTSMAILSGRSSLGSSGTASRPASRSRMPSWKASMGDCATSC